MKERKRMLIDKQINLYIDWCKLDAGFTPATIETKRYNLLKFKQQTEITDISEFNAQKFTAWKMAMLSGEFGGIKYTPQTCNNRIKTVITFVKWCKDMGIKTSIKTPLMTTFRSPEDVRDYTYYSKNQVLEVAKLYHILNCQGTITLELYIPILHPLYHILNCQGTITY